MKAHAPLACFATLVMVLMLGTAPVAAQTRDLPPLTPTGSTASPAGQLRMRLRLEALDREIGVLGRSRPRLVGPVAVTAVGGGLAVVAGGIAIGYGVLMKLSPCGKDGTTCERAKRDNIRSVTNTMGVTALVGGAVAIVGVSWLALRLGQRRRHALVMDALTKDRRRLRERLELSFEVVATGPTASLRGAF